MIEREDVLAVARLARLELSDEELEPMARELAAVLDHIAKIGELDLDGVPPTSHVAELTGALRPDDPVPSFPRDVRRNSWIKVLALSLQDRDVQSDFMKNRIRRFADAAGASWPRATDDRWRRPRRPTNAGAWTSSQIR